MSKRWKDVLPNDIVQALFKTLDVIEATYGQDENGERDDSEPHESAADIVERLLNIELLVSSAVDQLYAFVDIRSTGRA